MQQIQTHQLDSDVGPGVLQSGAAQTLMKRNSDVPEALAVITWRLWASARHRTAEQYLWDLDMKITHVKKTWDVLRNCPWKLIFQLDNRSSAPIRTVGAAHSSLVAASCSALIKNCVGLSFLPSSLKDFTVIPLVLLLFLSATCSGSRSSISCVLLSCRHSWSTRLPLSSSVYRSLSIISVDARTALIIFTVTVYRSRCGRPFRLCLMLLWLNDKACVSACY